MCVQYILLMKEVMILTCTYSALELLLIKRKIKGPSWLSISKFSSCPGSQRVRLLDPIIICEYLYIKEANTMMIFLMKVSWCKFEVIVDSPKDVQTSTSSSKTSEIPSMIVSAINIKTIINERQNVNEIVSASVICCQRAKVNYELLSLLLILFAMFLLM